jgi:hypothetical protein
MICRMRLSPPATRHLSRQRPHPEWRTE